MIGIASKGFHDELPRNLTDVSDLEAQLDGVLLLAVEPTTEFRFSS